MLKEMKKQDKRIDYVKMLEKAVVEKRIAEIEAKKVNVDEELAKV